jgi:hypothetical protein
MNAHDQYQKAADIADLLLSRGYPVRNFEVVDGMMTIRFQGPRAQDVHADAGTASFEGFAEAYDKAPP